MAIWVPTEFLVSLESRALLRRCQPLQMDHAECVHLVRRVHRALQAMEVHLELLVKQDSLANRVNPVKLVHQDRTDHRDHPVLMESLVRKALQDSLAKLAEREDQDQRVRMESKVHRVRQDNLEAKAMTESLEIRGLLDRRVHPAKMVSLANLVQRVHLDRLATTLSTALARSALAVLSLLRPRRRQRHNSAAGSGTHRNKPILLSYDIKTRRFVALGFYSCGLCSCSSASSSLFPLQFQILQPQ